jgi:hypothetical protein
VREDLAGAATWPWDKEAVSHLGKWNEDQIWTKYGRKNKAIWREFAKVSFGEKWNTKRQKYLMNYLVWVDNGF